MYFVYPLVLNFSAVKIFTILTNFNVLEEKLSIEDFEVENAQELIKYIIESEVEHEQREKC